MSVRLWAVVPAAGVGSRMGAGCPKQYLQLAGEAVLSHSVRALLSEPRIESLMLVLRPDDCEAQQLGLFADSRVQRVDGGAQRCDSVYAGLVALQAQASEADWVLVHDAARPCLGAGDLSRLIDAVLASGEGALLARPVVETLKCADASGRVERTVDRRHYWRAQTPQMFRLGELLGALQAARRAGFEVTDEASAMEHAGAVVQLVEGSADNIKITLPGDLELAAWYLRQRECAPGVEQGAGECE